MNDLTRTAAMDAVAWLINKRPADVDRALRSRALSRGVALKTDNDGYRPGLVAQGDPEALGAFKKNLENAMSPAPPQSVEEWLAEVQKIVVSPRHDEFDAALQLRAYVDRLGAYPADVTRDVLLGWDGHFFPSWSELKERLDRARAPRVRMLNAVRHNSRQLGQPTTEPPITDAERVEVKKYLDRCARRARSAGRVRSARPAPWPDEDKQD